MEATLIFLLSVSIIGLIFVIERDLRMHPAKKAETKKQNKPY
jgi:hypothetical protein